MQSSYDKMHDNQVYRIQKRERREKKRVDRNNMTAHNCRFCSFGYVKVHQKLLR